MANLAGEYWATDGGAGGKTGLSLANAAAVDPNDANDLWTIINAGTVVSDVIINLCVDGTASIATTIDITKDATTANRIICQGRNAADTADARVVLDAGGGAFSVLTLTTCDYWTFKDIVAFNTDRGVSNDGWSITANADRCLWIGCEAIWCYVGFDGSVSSTLSTFFNCLARNNKNMGISSASTTSRTIGCVAHNNGSMGIYTKSISMRDISYDNATQGFQGTQWVQSVAYRNGSDGFRITTSSFGGVAADCISAENGAWGYKLNLADHTLYLLRSGDYSNTSGRVDFIGSLIADEDDPGLSVDPFVEGAPKYERGSGASGCTSVDNGGESNLEDLSNGSWGGSVEIGDRIRFFAGSLNGFDAEESIVTAVSVGGDDDIITVSPQVTVGTQKKCWLGGGNFALNDAAGGGTLCRNTAGRLTTDGWSKDYLDIGAVQHLEAGAAGGLAKLAGMGGGLVG